MAIDAATRRLVRLRSGNRCEYCRCHQDAIPLVTFHIDHIVARQHDGPDDLSNLCLSCHWCNFHKGTNLATQVEGQLVQLFHPRLQDWEEHFAVVEDRIIGLTLVGRGSVELLSMNDEDRRELRWCSTHSI